MGKHTDNHSRPAHTHARAHMTGAECFNFYFPQELDKEYLVVWDKYSGPKWRYLKPDMLLEFLEMRVAQGFAFPLNPKWLLCDPGYYKIYEQMMQNEKLDEQMEVWFPKDSGIRERIAVVAHEWV